MRFVIVVFPDHTHYFSCVSSPEYFFVLVNDLYIGDPLEANKTGNMHIPVRLLKNTLTTSPAVCIGHTTIFLN